MAVKRMLVDATHPEETRIVVTSGNKLEEFDFESASRKQLRGNIYLAKITRVEPSLQAAFVEYGGNRQGFLAFSEIHPDYYQIPIADKEALLAIEAQEIAKEKSAEESIDLDSNDVNEDKKSEEENAEQDDNNEDDTKVADATDDASNELDEETNDSTLDDDAGNSELVEKDTTIEQIGGIDALDDEVEVKKTPIKRYKIQEVIKRRQIILIQVVKEERGNKGAALTTNLSLAGRYSVLMPNTARGGGISRKITNSSDRKRLKEVANELEVPSGMGVILRTAGASRTKAEIKRDFEYLMRLWEDVRTLTLKTSAPCLVYEEGSLIKRTIRDLYNKDITELFVAGTSAHNEAKKFMKMIMPMHEKRVKLYKGSQPIFSKYNVETQLNSMFSPQVTLPSGGYIVINPTEALVSIDVNSGRATKERNIEATALQTNLEAAEEVARQLRLRDMAGLVVIDFIDMMEKRSVRSVEKKLKDALQSDRARIQVGRISHFGLLEMSRQRMRFGVLESSTNTCPTCEGAGIIRSTESMAIMVMRAIEDHVQRKPKQSINVLTPNDIALFLLNNKRNTLSGLENKHNLSITISTDKSLVGSGFQIEKGERRFEIAQNTNHISIDSTQMAEITDEEASEEDDKNSLEKNTTRSNNNQRSRKPSHSRNKNTPNRNQDTLDNENAKSGENIESKDDKEATDLTNNANENNENNENNVEGEEPKKRRRRGRRGGRRNRRNPKDENSLETNAEENTEANSSETNSVEANSSETNSIEKPKTSDIDKPKSDIDKPKSDTEKPKVEDKATTNGEEEPKKKTRRVRKKQPAKASNDSDVSEATKAASPVDKPKEAAAETNEKPKASQKKKNVSDEIVVTSTKSSQEEKSDAGNEKKSKKGGWWQRVLK